MKINTQIQEKAKKKQLYIFQEWAIQRKQLMKADFKNVADELDEILNKKREKFTSICVRFGNVKIRKEMQL